MASNLNLLATSFFGIPCREDYLTRDVPGSQTGHAQLPMRGCSLRGTAKRLLGGSRFSAALYRYLLPFLGPFYAWVSVLEDGAAWPLPEALVILLRWIADRIELNKLVDLKLAPPAHRWGFLQGRC